MGCKINAFMMFWSACSSIYLLTALSYGRYQAINKQISGTNATNTRQCYTSIAVCLLLGFFWAIMPILGWSQYALEGLGSSCSVAWHQRTWNALSYNISIFFSSFLVPFTSLIFINFKLIKIVISYIN